MRTLRLALAYFALTFGAGFVLGPLRVLYVEPRIGERAAQLAEMPLMLGAIWLAALFVARRVAPDAAPRQRLALGAIAVACIVAADTAVGVHLRGMTVAQALFERDPVAGPAYYASLAFCALAPWLAGRRLRGRVAGRAG